MKIKCIVVDDEPLAIRVIESHIEKLNDIELVAKCSNAIEALDILKNNKIDLIFLDIQMPELTGLEFMNTLQNPPSVIFTTAYRNYAIDAFELDVLDYLLKPITFERFLKAINKFYKLSSYKRPETLGDTSLKHAGSEPFIYIKRNKTMVKLLLKDILFIESLKDYIRIHTDKESYMTKQQISVIEKNLPDEHFLRVHKSFIVSIEKITTFSPNYIGINDKQIPIGRSYKAYVLNNLNYGKNF
ncbi:response regulator transcription factor [bacterium]|nr:response regulator transcription factor [bacterium]